MEMATHPVNEVSIKPASPTSSIGGLRPSTLKQLKIGKVHHRRVLKGSLSCRTLCTNIYSGLMVVNVFEDEEGNATPMYISNAIEGNGGSAQAQRYYPQGAKVAVKEPYLTRLPDGEIVLLVEKMTDLVFLWVPDHVEDDLVIKGNGNCEDEWGEVSVLKQDGEDEIPMSDPKDVGKCDLSVMGEDVKGSSTGKQGTFNELLNLEGNADNGNVPVVEEVVRSYDTSRELKLNESTTRHAKNEDLQGDRKYEDDITVDALQRSPGEIDGVKAENLPNQASEVEHKVIDENEEVSENDIGSRDMNIEGLLSIPKLKNDDANHKVEVSRSADGLIVGGGEVKFAPKIDAKQRVCDCEGALLEVLNDGILQGEHTWNADAGEEAASLRVKGNALFAKGEYKKATEMYGHAVEKAQLDRLKKEEVLCLSNRAEVWLLLCQNQAALDDADAALMLLRQFENDTIKGDLALAKALFRKGRALMGLHKYEDAMRVLQEVLGKAPADRQLHEAATKCRYRLQRVLKPGKRQRAAMIRRKSGSYMLQ